MIRERIHDSLPRRLSPSLTSDRDGNDSIMIKHRDVVSHGTKELEQHSDGIRRECGYSDLYDVEIQKRIGFSNKNRREDEDSGKYHLNRSESTETVPSRFITSHDYEYSQSHREYSDSYRLSKDGGDRGIYMQDSSPLSQVGSNEASFEDENVKLVSLDDRVDERRRQYLCASQDLQTRCLDDYVGRNSAREQHEKSRHDSPTVSKCGKEVVDESGINYHRGPDIAMREFCSVKNKARESDLRMQRRESLSNSYARGSNIFNVDAAERMNDQYDMVKEHNPFVESGSRVVNERDDMDFHYMNFRNEESKVVYLDNKCQLLRKDCQYDGVDSRTYLDFSGPYAVVDRDDKASQSISLNKEREAYLDNERNAVFVEDKRRELRNDHYFGNDDRASQSKTLNKEREAYFGNARNAFYSDDKRREQRNEYHFGNDERIHSDVHRADLVVDQDGRVVQLQRGCLNKGKTAYLDNERQLEKGYDSRTDARMYPDILVDREDATGQSYYRGVPLNDRKETYLQCENQQLLKDYETNSHVMMHPDVNKSDILVDWEDSRGQRYYRGVSLNDREEAYFHQKLLKDYETNSHVIMHPDVNKSVDWKDSRGQRYYRGVSLNDREEAYFHQQLLKDYETNSHGMVHPNLNKSDIPVDREDARALERRRISFDDGKESYMDNERRDAHLRYQSQQLKKDYDYGIDDMIYRDVNSSGVIVDHGDAKELELRRATFSDRNKSYLDNGSNDVYRQYKQQQLEKDFYSGIDDTMYADVTKSEIVTDRGDARALERRGVSLYDGREAYLHYERQQLLRDREIDSYGMMNSNVSRSSTGTQDEEALRCRKYVSDDRNQVYLDDEHLQLRNDGHVKVHANTRYLDGRQEVYHSNDSILHTRDDYSHRDDASEVIHENMVYDYNYNDVKPLRRSYEKADSERFHEREVAYDYRDKQVKYAVDGGTSTERVRYFADERNFVNADHTSTQRPRVSAKERLGGRVKEESHVHVKNRVLHRVRNSKLKGKSHNRNYNR